MFWDIYCKECSKIDKKPNKVASELGLSAATTTKWKSGTIPNGETLVKIADYFNVSVDYLLGREESPQQGNNIQTGGIQGGITGNNNLSIATAPPPQPPTDSVTDEFLKVFQELSFPDKLYVMNCAMEKVKKGA